MKRFLATMIIVLFTATAGFAGSINDYQATGTVLEVTDTKVVIEKGKEKWEIARDKDTKVTGDLKVGTKVTIKYTMKAGSIEVKK